jgi:hypothetical protein
MHIQCQCPLCSNGRNKPILPVVSQWRIRKGIERHLTAGAHRHTRCSPRYGHISTTKVRQNEPTAARVCTFQFRSRFFHKNLSTVSQRCKAFTINGTSEGPPATICAEISVSCRCKSVKVRMKSMVHPQFRRSEIYDSMRRSLGITPALVKS